MNEANRTRKTSKSGPGSGPRLLFFSGGTALRRTARALPRCTHNSIHVVTPFDSGGSSAELRRAFHMPAVGDFRNRLLALAHPAHSAAGALAAVRLESDCPRAGLEARLDALCEDRDPELAKLPDAARSGFSACFCSFREHMPPGFDLRNASLGNLVITGAWLDNGHRIEPALTRFAQFVKARGAVLPVVDADLHLAARLADGRQLLGQHCLTGKETAAIESPVRDVWLTRDLEDPTPVRPTITADLAATIAGADLVCFPMGSFYSSIVANLLPAGVGEAVSRAQAPRVFVPNQGHDPESLGLDVSGATQRLVQILQQDVRVERPPSHWLQYVLVDTVNGRYPGIERLEPMGIRVIDRRLLTRRSAPLIDENLLIEALMSLV